MLQQEEEKKCQQTKKNDHRKIKEFEPGVTANGARLLDSMHGRCIGGCSAEGERLSMDEAAADRGL